ncbi:MAG: helix-turn-helix domain-containing protein [Armatimonadetes bacterium]|nr:helix-turn-helix domain-containing protein [Armatimonadota bacterium]
MNNQDSSRDAYKPEEIATRLSISRAHVYRLLDRGELKSIKIGRSRRVTNSQLHNFLAVKEQHS